MQKKDIYLICVTMIICSIIIGLIVGSFIFHGLEVIAQSYSFLHFMNQTDRSNPVFFLS